MNITWLKKIAVIIEKKQNNIFTFPVKKQAKYVNHFKDPQDEFERSYFQYCCQMKLYGPILHIMLNIAALPISILLLSKYKKKNITPQHFEECLFFQNGLPNNIIPNSLKQKYSNILCINIDEHSLTKEDLSFLRDVFKKYPLSWMLWLKTIIVISQYSAFKTKYSPAAIISCSEFSFTSSLVTKYCRLNNIKRINVMHGEKLYDMHDSFVEFDEFYVWSQEYANLLCSLRASPDQFRIEIPQSLQIEKFPDVKSKYDYTYYLGGETDEELHNISKVLHKLLNNGERVAIRPHPRYSNISKIQQIFSFIDIEDTAEVTIEHSLLQTKNVISLYSTVLTQAYYSGINLIIDDVSAPKKYNKLEELGYVMLSVEHTLLSTLVRDTK